MSTTRRSDGFTLAELLIVLVIIGILAAIAVPIFLSQTENAQIAALKSDLDSAAALLDVAEVEKEKDPSLVLPDHFGAGEANAIPGVGSLTPSENINVVYWVNPAGQGRFCVEGATPSGYQMAYSREDGFYDGTCAGGPDPGPDPGPTPDPSPTVTPTPDPDPTPTPDPGPTPTPDPSGTWEPATFVPASYTCPEGATLDGTECVTKADIPGYYDCPSGGTLKGDKCETQVWVPGGTYYTCNSGDSLSGTTCTRTYNEYYCPQGGSLSGTTCTTQTLTGYYCDGSAYPAAEIIDLDGTQCRWYAWVCPSGYDKVTGSLCRRVAGPYTSGDTCTRVKDSLGTTGDGYPKYVSGTWTAGTTTYTCPSGWTLSGTKCSKTTTSTKTATLGPANTASQVPYCSTLGDGWVGAGSYTSGGKYYRNCEKTITTTDTQDANPSGTPGYCTYYQYDYSYNATKTYRGGFPATPKYRTDTYTASTRTSTETYAAKANTTPGYWTTTTNPATWHPPAQKDTRTPATNVPAHYECRPGGRLEVDKCFYPAV